MNPTISIAASGHVTIDFGAYDSELYQRACATLEVALGFVRQGKTVFGLEQGVEPSFLRDEVEISTGWDNWSGRYLLANSDPGDAILRHLHADLLS